ncbi:MAG: type II toxin-antitoxin system RelE/ParE family toxin [Cytophagales bacterium]|jgi:toxin ParE1/3/4|nr:type II toxin-antitoxin system RelE/ParE family toxin [Cytophagales bacterium]MCA6366676.1 type II toxin-antitoxin system RelE/ParE family toxin [Cytophagales bacterium]MCA6372689.1 type II toxin-antitoxin system RelE/ParE family toxin [Cytophagales bacterium]MCA6377545.1 type II toxin-antitoxin system RelE/ParE family toxin [Cytophagales bacterium]MCA6384712.1 type II toxin-antitoxin system RelE/ParE family toxin [Cytophagales bacterium]
MKYTVEYDDEVQNDLQETIDWYADQKEGLDREFIENVKSAIAQITENPFVYRPRFNKIRFKHLDRFPYIVVFKIIKDTLLVFAIIHDKRNPKLIRKRLK